MTGCSMLTEVLEALCCRLAAEQGAGPTYSSSLGQPSLGSGGNAGRGAAAHSETNRDRDAVAKLITSVLAPEPPHSLAVGASLAAAQLKLAQVDRSADKAHDAMIAFSATAHQISQC